MIGRRLAQIVSLEKRIAELSERVHVLEQHRRVELNRQNTGDLRAGSFPIPPTPPPSGFLRAGWSEDVPMGSVPYIYKENPR